LSLVAGPFEKERDRNVPIPLRKSKNQMPEINDTISKILAKYPVISPGEEDILNNWLEEEHHREIFESVTNNECRISLLERLDEMNIQASEMWQRFQDTYITSPPQKAGTVWWGHWTAYMAAASIIVIAAIGLKWLGSNKHYSKPEQSAMVQNNDVQPGGYKARLTLSDGRVISIDSATSGSLVQQGSVSVVNKNGQLLYQQQGKEEKELFNTLTTAKGQMYATVLSDGTKLWLNSMSSVRYPVSFNGNLRQVEIAGEAYFEVAEKMQEVKGKMQKIPFIVKGHGVEVGVLGTHFNVNSYDDEDAVKTTLLEGKVRVRSTSNNAVAILRPGQEASLNVKTQQLTRVDDVDVEEAIAWRNGYFQFNDRDLMTVLAQLIRWYDVEVIYQGAVPEKKFWGKIPRSNTLSQTLDGLGKFGLHFTIQGKKVIVSDKP
jgi:hypothetical protein